MSTRNDLKKFVRKYGSDFANPQTVRLGRLDGVTVETGTPGVLWARQWNGKEIKVINRALVPSTFDLRVRVGIQREQPNRWIILQIENDYLTPAAGGLIGFHHLQHEFEQPDMVMVDRRQTIQLSLIAIAGTLTAQLYGAVVPTANGLVLVDNEILNFAPYIPAAGALYVMVEVDDNGDVSYNVGDNFYAPSLASVIYYPQPTTGKYPLYVVMLFDSMTALTNDLIKPIMSVGMIPPTTGLQIDGAPSDTPQDADKFPFWDVYDQELKTVPWGSIKPNPTTVYTDDISNPPTEAEITILLGGAVWRGAGYNAFIKDSTTGKPLYWCVSDGSRWHFFALTKSVYESSDYITLSELDYYSVTSPDIYSQGLALGNLTDDPGQELVVMSGGSLTTVPPVGRAKAYDSQGNVLWTFTSPLGSYGMLADMGDVNGDEYNEVAMTFNVNEAAAFLVDRNGNTLWRYAMVGGNYARGVRIGKVRNDYPNLQVVVGGWNGQFVLLDENGAEIWRKTLGSLTVQSIRIADIDADGNNEIVIAYNRDVRAYDELGNLIWSRTLGDVDNDIISVDVGNVTGSAGLEILATARPRWGSGSIRGAYLLNSSGVELWHWNPTTGNGCEGGMLQDLDGDGIDEVIVGWGNHPDGADPGGVGHMGGITILDSTGAELGTWTGTETVEFFAWGDVNNDGAPELVATGSDGKTHIFRVLLAHSPDEGNLGRLTAYEDTKANAEALAGSLSEIMFAHATDTGEIGFLVNGTWTWMNPTPPTIGQYRQFTYVVSGGDFSFIIDADGKPIMALQDLE